MDPEGEMKRETSDQDTVFLHFNLLQYYTLHNTGNGKLVKEKHVAMTLKSKPHTSPAQNDSASASAGDNVAIAICFELTL